MNDMACEFSIRSKVATAWCGTTGLNSAELLAIGMNVALAVEESSGAAF